MSDTLPIYERFATFQGEGVHMGKPAFFLRTYGCPVQCPWCDSAGTWHKDFVPNHVDRWTVPTIADEVEKSGHTLVVITGGEPTIHNLGPLTKALRERNNAVHLETSGAFEFVGHGRFDWITLSPKKWKLPLKSSVAIADEFKVIAETPDDIYYYLQVLTDLGVCKSDGRPVWVHPEWSKHKDEDLLNAINFAVMEMRGWLRAGWQLHKLYRVDTLDGRSKPLVPLGGDLAKGY